MLVNATINPCESSVSANISWAFSRLRFPIGLPLALIAMNMLTGCITSDEQMNRWAFTCPDDYEFTTTFSQSGESVTFEDESQKLKLDRERSASGTLYTDGMVVFWNKGVMARVELGEDVVYQDCQGENI